MGWNGIEWESMPLFGYFMVERNKIPFHCLKIEHNGLSYNFLLPYLPLFRNTYNECITS